MQIDLECSIFFSVKLLNIISFPVCFQACWSIVRLFRLLGGNCRFYNSWTLSKVGYNVFKRWPNCNLPDFSYVRMVVMKFWVIGSLRDVCSILAVVDDSKFIGCNFFGIAIFRLAHCIASHIVTGLTYMGKFK